MDLVTLTGNLLAEWTFVVPSLEPGKTHRAVEMSFQVGGKGINVTRILNRLGGSSMAVGFAEGHLGALCAEWLERHAIRHKLFPLQAGVRPGVVLRQPDAPDSETTFLGADLPVPVSSWKAACQFAGQSRPRWLAVCGSIPGWSASWSSAIRQIGASGVKVCADTYGPPLADLVKLPLELVKINRGEFARLFPQAAGLGAREAITLARASSPVRNWILTDGAAAIAASFANGTSCLVTPTRIREVSPTGSGDTFLAAILHKWPDDGRFTDALAFASACASANAASPGIGDFPLPVPERFQPAITGLPES